MSRRAGERQRLWGRCGRLGRRDPFRRAASLMACAVAGCDGPLRVVEVLQPGVEEHVDVTACCGSRICGARGSRRRRSRTRGCTGAGIAHSSAPRTAEVSSPQAWSGLEEHPVVALVRHPPVALPLLRRQRQQLVEGLARAMDVIVREGVQAAPDGVDLEKPPQTVLPSTRRRWSPALNCDPGPCRPRRPRRRDRPITGDLAGAPAVPPLASRGAGRHACPTWVRQ